MSANTQDTGRYYTVSQPAVRWPFIAGLIVTLMAWGAL